MSKNKVEKLSILQVTNQAKASFKTMLELGMKLPISEGEFVEKQIEIATLEGTLKGSRSVTPKASLLLECINNRSAELVEKGITKKKLLEVSNSLESLNNSIKTINENKKVIEVLGLLLEGNANFDFMKLSANWSSKKKKVEKKEEISEIDKILEKTNNEFVSLPV